MDEKSIPKRTELIQPEGAGPVPAEPEVTLEQLESLCYGFASRARGCSFFNSVSDTEDVLF